MVTQRVSHRLIKYNLRSWSQRGTLRSTGHIMITTRYSNNRDPNRDKTLARSDDSTTYRPISIKTMPLSTNYSFNWLECCQYFRI